MKQHHSMNVQRHGRTDGQMDGRTFNSPPQTDRKNVIVQRNVIILVKSRVKVNNLILQTDFFKVEE